MQSGMPGSLAVSKTKFPTIRRRGRGAGVKTKKDNVFAIQMGKSTEPALVYFEVPEVSIKLMYYSYDDDFQWAT